MLSKLKQRKSEGFTIIEVMIVLAIAGLIMLIVFLAVPALQRNSRNTQAKNAAAAILAAVNEFSNNNNGQQPTTVAIAADGTINVTGAAGTAAATGKTQSGYTASLSSTMPTTPGTFAVNLNHKCNNNAFATATSPRSMAVGYAIESSSTVNAPQCAES